MSATIAANRGAAAALISATATCSGLRISTVPSKGLDAGSRKQGRPLKVVRAMAATADLAEEKQEEEKFNVYNAPTELLGEGVRKHTLSVFVADEPGLINRVAGVFARRGYNIDSLAVGLNIDKALFTIVVTGTDNEIKQLCKQVNKLVKVRSVEDLSSRDRVERELAMIKIANSESIPRLEVMRLVEVFRASIVDVTPDFITLAITGDPGKTIALQRALSVFGVKEVARTGKIALVRGRQLQPTVGGWGDSERIRRQNEDRLARFKEVDDAREEAEERQMLGLDEGGGDETDGSSSSGSGVYNLSHDEADAVWDVQILDPVVEEAYGTGFRPHVLSISVANIPGVLDKVTGVVARRGYNVQSLAVGPAESQELSRITMVVPGTPATISKLIKQLEKLVDVVRIKDLEGSPHVDRDLMLVKIRCSPKQRGEVRDLMEIFRGGICDVSADTVTIEVLGKNDKMTAIQNLLAPYGILEVARTGTAALVRESGVNSELIETAARVRSL